MKDQDSFSPLISVIIPCYNYGHLLQECVQSVMTQTYTQWECIIVDDGSVDNSAEVARSIEQSDPRVRFIQQTNSGPAVARNLGVSHAKGEFIQFLDADDLLQPEKFEHQLSLFKIHPETDIVYGSVRYFATDQPAKLYEDIALNSSPTWMKDYSGKGEEMIIPLLKGNIMVIQAPLVRKKLFEKFGSMRPELFYNEDWELWARFALNGACFRYSDQPGTYSLVRVHKSYSTDNFNMFVYGLVACCILRTKIEQRKYRKIMEPKINYHMRVIDERLMVLLKADRPAAIEKAALIHRLTGIKRYAKYVSLFNTFPPAVCYLYSRFLFLFLKLKNTLLYA